MAVTDLTNTTWVFNNSLTGYNPSATQTLKNVNGTIQLVTD